MTANGRQQAVLRDASSQMRRYSAFAVAGPACFGGAANLPVLCASALCLAKRVIRDTHGASEMSVECLRTGVSYLLLSIVPALGQITLPALWGTDGGLQIHGVSGLQLKRYHQHQENELQRGRASDRPGAVVLL